MPLRKAVPPGGVGNLTTAADAFAIVTRYFDAAEIPPKTRVALEELLPE